MKFSLVRQGKNNEWHLSVKTVEWFMNRIQTDTKAEDIGKLRQHIASCGRADYYDKLTSIAEVYPSAELVKTANGRLEIASFNSLVVLHVTNLLRPTDIENVKKQAETLPMTFAAFAGADGRSVEGVIDI